jgi:Transposase DDE domain
VRIANILHRQFAEDLVRIHGARVRVVFVAACALLRGGRISLTSIGRAIAVGTSHKHGIKRVDRLLGNEQLWKERMVFFRAIARRVIPVASRPAVIVDWTSFNPTMWSLVAAVSFEGRAVVIYSETHSVFRYNKPDVHRRFLRRLREVLPEQCVPIIVTDAGFRSPWMKEVAALGWDYICRVRGLTRLRESGTVTWLPLRRVFSQIYRGAKDFGFYELGRQARYRARVIGFRKRRAVNRTGRQWRENWGDLVKSDLNKHLRAASEPWILATSLRSAPKKIVAHYRRRMQIEETFRDAKSTRFGLSMVQASTKSEHRADILMLLASLAHLLSIVTGLVAEARNLGRGYQANTLRTRRVFSLSRLGRFILAGEDSQIISHSAVAVAWETLQARLTLLETP